MSRSRRIAGIMLPLLLVAVTLLSAPSAYAQYTAAPKVRAALAPTSTIYLKVDSARDSLSTVRGAPKKGTQVTAYKWLISLDNTGNPAQSNLPNNDSTACHPSGDPVVTPPAVADPKTMFPALCAWPSIHQSSAAPALSTGTQCDWSNPSNTGLASAGCSPATVKAIPLPGAADPASGKVTGLPSECDIQGYPKLAASLGLGYSQPCKFLVSVTADGYELSGAHFSNPMSVPLGTASGTVLVHMNPYPLPLGNIKILAFQDVSPTDATYEANVEPLLPGFVAKVADMNGVISVDYFGNPLCTTYQVWQNSNPRAPFYNASAGRAGLIVLNGDGTPTVKTIGGRCVTGADGEVTIPNMTPGHYAVSLTPSDASQTQNRWVQTTTLEGAHDFDVWVMANDVGNDTELVVGGEPVAFVHFGYVPGYLNFPATPVGVTPPAGEIKGKLMTGLPYVPGVGGLPGTINTAGNAGLKLGKPVKEGWIALNDMQNNDQLVWSGPAYWDESKPNDPLAGTFDIKNVPAGTYNLAVWDRPQNYLIDGFNITVGTPGSVATPAEIANAGAPGSNLVDVGVVPLIGWFTDISGKICVDTNGNSRCDPGEPGVPDFVLQNLNRTNNMYEQGQNAADTNDAGNYEFLGAYPLGQFTVLQAFNPRYKTTGITYQACNDPQEHTIQTGAVDISFLPVFGQCGRVDWAVSPYDAKNGENGGIVATVFYDPIRQGYNARQANTNTYQTGIPNIPMHLLSPVKAADGSYALDPTSGAYQTAPPPADTPGPNYTTESYGRPTGCLPRAADGTPITNIPTSTYFQDVAKVYTDANGIVDMAAQASAVCIEAPLTGVSMGLGTPDINNYSGQTVDGNYALAPNAPGDWLVQMEVPKDLVINDGVKTVYKVTTENNLSMFPTPSQFVPQGAYDNQVAWPPQMPASAVQMTPGDYQENPHTSANGPDAICAGATFTVTNSNPNVAHNGGSPLFGQTRHTCDLKLFHVEAGQSVAPNFHLYTDVPLPTKFSGYITDDAAISTNPRTTFFGEVSGVANSPIGIYDWTGRQVYEVNSDYNGVWEVLMPSSTVVCPTPSKFCPGVYRFVGNDPGQPGAPNLNHDPNYRVISAMFNAWPGMFTPADVAPTRAVTQILGLSGQFKTNVVCSAKVTDPQIFAIDQPYINTATHTLTIKGLGFGATAGTVNLVDKNGTPHGLGLTGTGWSDTQIVTNVSRAAQAGGSYSLQVTTAAGAQTVNGVGFTVLDSTYSPTLYEVGPGKTFDPTAAGGEHAIQNALNRAATNSPGGALVVVYPNVVSDFTPLSAYYENVVIHSPLKLQGVGPGGTYTDPNTLAAVAVQGSVIDGQYFNATTSGTALTVGEPTLDAWYTLVTGLTWAGDQNIADAEVIYVLAKQNEWANASANFALGVDGFAIQNGNQLDFPGNIRQLGGAKSAAFPETVTTQGGALFLNGYADNFVLSNNLVKGDDGAYGAIRVGSPKQGTNLNSPNHNVQLTHNRIVLSGGTNLAGAVGVFTGSDGYRIDHNVFCGNSTVEYGGAISHYGLSRNGRIDHNQIYLNQSIDEGAGIQVSGELPTPTGVSPGSGPLTIDHNYIGANLAGDDGGGIRLLMAGNFPISIYNNMITNNVSLHEGGAIAIDDSTNVTIANNTIAKNITTATAPTSSGQPAPAGISSVMNSGPLQKTLPTTAPLFSDPHLYNNIFWDNRAGSWTPKGVAGVGMIPGEQINRWDLGVADGSGYLTPHNSLLNTAAGGPQGGWQQDGGSTNQVMTSAATAIDDNAVQFAAPFNIELTLAAQRTYFRFRPSAIVSVSLPVNAIGDYHLSLTSPAANVGLLADTPTDTTNSGATVPTDIDDQTRPAGTRTDAGADQVTAPGPVVNLAPRVTTAAPRAILTAQVRTAVRAILNLFGLRFQASIQPQPDDASLPLMEALVMLGMFSLVLLSAGLLNARRRRDLVRLRIDQPDSDREVQP